jgi:hypothetical protein
MENEDEEEDGIVRCLILPTLREACHTRSLWKISSKCLDVDATLKQSCASRCPAMHCRRRGKKGR